MDLTRGSPSPFSKQRSPSRPARAAPRGGRRGPRRRRLIRYLVQADIHKKGADTLLGNLWWVLDPLLQMVVYVVLVSVIFDRAVPDYPLFIFAAILPWKWFQSSVQDGDHVGVRRGAADPPDPVPQARAAGRGGWSPASSTSPSA